MKVGTQVTGKLDVSVVLPAHNEATYLEESVGIINQALKDIGRSYEIIVAEDGSTDGTDKLADRLAEENPAVRHIHGEKRLGRGRALKNTFRQAKGEVLIYMDVDLATDIRHLKELIDSILVEGYDLSTGSRLLAESKVQRTGTRNITSKAYNFLVRAILGSKIKDHQCGFKAFKRGPLMQLLDEVQAKHWFWDTEIIVRAAHKGLRIKEIPVEWKSGRDTKVHIFKDSWNMFWQIVSLWWTMKVRRK